MINKQSNLYTVIYIAVLVIVVGAALAFTAMTLRPLQQANAKADKMAQILAAVNIPSDGNVAATFNSHITEMLVVDEEGAIVRRGGADDDEIFNINVAEESKLDADKRELPVYVCSTANGIKYIIPVAGNGLWGPIWGYVAVNADETTSIYGAFFSHEGETPGLGAEIEKKEFRDEFIGKRLFIGDKFLPIAVVKGGVAPSDGRDFVDAISGGTITSKGVAAMLDNCLLPYRNFLETVKNPE